MKEKRLDLSDLSRSPEKYVNRLLRDPPARKTEPSGGHLKKSYDTKQYRFVPVGFRISDLEFLDRAVFELRQRGFKRATRSAIIRRLLDRHGREVVAEYE